MPKTLAFIVLFFFALPLGQARNLLPNGDFESPQLTGWQAQNPGGVPYTLALTTDTAKVHGGRQAVKIQDIGGTNSLFALQNSVSIAGSPTGTLLRARVYLKTENLVFAAGDKSIFLSPILVIHNKAGKITQSSFQTGTFRGSYEYTPVEILAQLPPDSTTATLQLKMSSTRSGTVYADDASLEVVENLGAPRKDIPRCQVAPDALGTPRLRINGKVQAPVFFLGNDANPVIYDETALAAKAGVDLIQIGMMLPWYGTSTGVIEQILHANPKALVLPRLGIYPPPTWIEANPGELILDQDGKTLPDMAVPSLASDRFIKAAKEQLELYIRYLQNSPYKDRIIGYHICYLGTGEWFYPDPNNRYVDFSEINRQRFARWARERYAGNLAKLNAAWKKSYPNFESIRIPPAKEWEERDDGLFRDPVRHRAVADYFLYHNELLADRIIELAEWTKKLTDNRSLTAFFYGYQNELIANGERRGMAHAGHLALGRVLASPAVDILCSPVSYYERGPGGPSNMMSIVDSVALAGKIFLQEDDSRTHLWKNPDLPFLHYPTEWDTMQCLRRNFGNVLAHNQAIWWMDLFGNGNYNSPAIWQNNQRLAEIYRDSMEHQIPFQPQVALIYDEDSYFWLTANCLDLTRPNAYASRVLFQSLGAQVGYYQIQDLPRLPASVRLLVFVNTFRIDQKEEALIQAAKKSGRTLLWLYAPGYVTETALSKDRMEKLTGFALEKESKSIRPGLVIDKISLPLTEGLKGHVLGDTEPISPTFYGRDSKTQMVLGNYSATGRPGLLLRDFPGWRSIFAGAPSLSVPLLRAIARDAGVTLLVDADDLTTSDALQTNGRYLFAYARNHEGRCCFQVQGELIPNGGFEKFTGKLPTEGFGRWISPFYGSTPPCTVIATAQAHSGKNALQTGPLAGRAGESSTPLAIRLNGRGGMTYKLSGWVRVKGLNASAARPGDFIHLAVNALSDLSAVGEFKLADGPKTSLTDDAWTSFSATYTHHDIGHAASDAMVLQLEIKGAYTAANILLDDLSVREEGCEPVVVRNALSGATLGTGVTGWTADFRQNEQKIFQLLPLKEDSAR